VTILSRILPVLIFSDEGFGLLILDLTFLLAVLPVLCKTEIASIFFEYKLHGKSRAKYYARQAAKGQLVGNWDKFDYTLSLKI
jgi:hypothetical protein